jgi:UDP-glucose 4-epimerase
MEVLVTGGAGYLGSTTAKALEMSGHIPVILDSLVSGPRAFVKDRAFFQGDIADRQLLSRVFENHPGIEVTIHMAARAVGPESVVMPYQYYRDNVARSLELIDHLAHLRRPRVVFSSSASLYAPVEGFEVNETAALNPLSPYARTKHAMENALIDMAAATDVRAIILRYFNPIGSDPDLESGPYAREPTDALGQLIMTATGLQDAFTIAGTDYATRDGTGIRDYLHAWDLAQAHVLAVERFDQVIAEVGGPTAIINIGSGTGVTVRELVAAFETVFGKRLHVRESTARRPGDAIGAFANVTKARDLLRWTSTQTIEDAISSALAWAGKRREVLGYD